MADNILVKDATGATKTMRTANTAFMLNTSFTAA